MLISQFSHSYQTRRRRTREVMVGNIGIGGSNPVRIQSMATAPTHEPESAVDQIMRLSDAGCEIVRVAVQGKREALCCEKIKSALLRKGYSIPLVADVHFYPPTAVFVADFVDKIRINPGNFADPRARFQQSAAHGRIAEKFVPLVEKCQRLKKPIRIGANLGSLSDRMMTRFGDTPRGMVESALEYAEICRAIDFHDIVFSMKASNPAVMIAAYRLLVLEMDRRAWDYPLHLGVTEAGAGNEGRIKSAMGIGALLLDGLGDTIRVSLTEDPCNEIDPCRQIVAKYNECCALEEMNSKNVQSREYIALREIPRTWVVAHCANEGDIADLLALDIVDKPDAVWVDQQLAPHFRAALLARKIELVDPACLLKGGLWPQEAAMPKMILFQPQCSPAHEMRRLAEDLKNRKWEVPVVICLPSSQEDSIIGFSMEAGAIFCDHLADGICLLAGRSLRERMQISYQILQSARLRLTKTEFISCPGCGRTLFDIQRLTSRVREQTDHLPGVKIAIMGCIVNGPGEMADADFGLVGSKPGKLDLYLGKTCVQQGIDIDEGPESLIALIQRQGRWVPP
jgi:(E)-4-hydroxy-3-methylbut-2-enyl-diphosphate synthase